MGLVIRPVRRQHLRLPGGVHPLGQGPVDQQPRAVAHEPPDLLQGPDGVAVLRQDVVHRRLHVRQGVQQCAVHIE